MKKSVFGKKEKEKEIVKKGEVKVRTRVKNMVRSSRTKKDKPPYFVKFMG